MDIRKIRKADVVRSIATLAALGMLASSTVTLSGILAAMTAEEETQASYETVTVKIEAEYLDVTAEDIPDDLELVYAIEGIVIDVERLMPQKFLALVDIPIYMRAVELRCRTDTACVRGVRGRLLDIEQTIWNPNNHDGNVGTLSHEIGHVVGHSGRGVDGVSYYDAFDEMIAANPDEPTLHATPHEDFAGSYQRYITKSNMLRAEYPARYAFMRDLFGRAYLTDVDGRIRIIAADSALMEILDRMDIEERSGPERRYGAFLDKSALRRGIRDILADTKYALPYKVFDAIFSIPKYVSNDTALCDGRAWCVSLEEGWLAVTAPYPGDSSDRRDEETYQRYYDARRVWLSAYLTAVGQFFVVEGGLLDVSAVADPLTADAVAEGFARYSLNPEELLAENAELYGFIDGRLGSLDWNRDNFRLTSWRFEDESQEGASETEAADTTGGAASDEGIKESDCELPAGYTLTDNESCQDGTLVQTDES